MSRIGKKPVAIPAGVEVKLENGIITVKGPKGELTQPVDEKLVSVKIEDGNVIVERDDDTKEKRSAHGLYRTLIHNMVSGDTLVLNLGYSHPIEMKDPEGITTEAPSQTEIIIKGIDKEQVGNYAAVIRKHRPPEPYKGKGIKYTGEVIIRKEGKSGAK